MMDPLISPCRARAVATWMMIEAQRVRRRHPPHTRWMLMALSLVLLCSPAAAAQDRWVRRFGVEDGLVVEAVRSLAQDSLGFIWIGTVGGLFRWDGVAMRRWASDRLDSWVNQLVVNGDGDLIVVQEGGDLVEVSARGATRVSGPDGQALTDVGSAAFDAEGGLWVVRGESVWRRSVTGAWVEFEPDRFRGRGPSLIGSFPSGGVALGTEHGFWCLDAQSGAARVLEARRPVAFQTEASGADLVLLSSGEVLRVESPGKRVELYTAPPRPVRGIDLVRRNGTLWASYDRYLVALRAGQAAAVMGPRDDLPGGGPFLVDHEGSLWLGTPSGLLQFPEPETTFWHERHGLPSAHTRHVARSGDHVYVTTWQGMGYLEWADGRWTAHSLDRWPSTRPLFVDSTGVVWASTTRGLVELVDGDVVGRHPLAAMATSYAPAPGGGTWVGTFSGLFHVRGQRRRPQPVRGLPFTRGATVREIVRGRSGRLWLAGDEIVCRTAGPPGGPPGGASWTCDTIPGAVEISGLVEVASGTVWASSERMGVLRLHQDRWEPVPGSGDLVSKSILNLVPARDDGIWILGHGTLIRVRENLESPAGWDVLERLSAWHGLPTDGGGDLWEEADGTLWIASARGLVKLPSEARRSPVQPPRVALVAVRVGDERVPLRRSPELRHRHNRLELRFAALSYRDPARIRYQVRLSRDDPWSHTDQPLFRWIDLPRGEYRAEVRASLDGQTWSPTPASFEFTVRAPWFFQPWAVALAILAIAGILYLIYKARIAFLLGLERHRTRIAMDLHDEMGSGLGSIGILSGVLAQDQLHEQDRQKLARAISDTAEELGTALSDIVWALDPRASTLEELASRLAEHGGRLFSDDSVRFTVDFPDRWPSARLGFAVRRSVLLIGLEALHNAARHSAARHVRLSLRQTGDGWRLMVEDDGCGLPPNVPDRERGVGFSSMQRRTAEIGARLAWSEPASGGTRVTLDFVPRPRQGLRWFRRS